MEIASIQDIVNDRIHPELVKYRAIKILHPHFEDAIDQIAERIQSSDENSMTAVVGSTGSGKSALADEIVRRWG